MPQLIIIYYLLHFVISKVDQCMNLLQNN